jgi:hypothetical protein
MERTTESIVRKTVELEVTRKEWLDILESPATAQEEEAVDSIRAGNVGAPATL